MYVYMYMCVCVRAGGRPGGRAQIMTVKNYEPKNTATLG